MRNQYIIIRSWMLGLGLSASELLALAVIHSYTSFRGCFDGDEDWLARWACVNTDKLADVIGSLESRGLIYRGVNRWGSTTYKSGTVEGASSRARNINNINNINIDNNKNNNINNINIGDNNKNDNMGDIPMGNINSDDNNKNDNMGNITADESKAADNGPHALPEAPAPSKKTSPPANRERMSEEEIKALIAPYECVADVPLAILSERLAKWDAMKGQ